jgi:hypothetical protein
MPFKVEIFTRNSRHLIERDIVKRVYAYLTGASLFMFYEVFEVFELCHTFTYFPYVPFLRLAVPQLHLFSRCALFEDSSVTVTLGVQMRHF